MQAGGLATASNHSDRHMDSLKPAETIGDPGEAGVIEPRLEQVLTEFEVSAAWGRVLIIATGRCHYRPNLMRHQRRTPNRGSCCQISEARRD